MSARRPAIALIAFSLLAALAALACTANAADTKSAPPAALDTAPAAPAPPPNATDAKTMLPSMVEGIVSYTRWPPELKQVRVCVIGEGPNARELLKVGAFGSALRAIEVQRALVGADANQDCQVLYFAARYSAKQRPILSRFVAKPFLTIGEGVDFCSDGGMFCVDPDESTGRFGVNLDAIARSGLRVNPQVLSLGRAKPKVTP